MTRAGEERDFYVGVGGGGYGVEYGRDGAAAGVCGGVVGEAGGARNMPLVIRQLDVDSYSNTASRQSDGAVLAVQVQILKSQLAPTCRMYNDYRVA